MAVKINFDTYLFISSQKISIHVHEKQSLEKLYYEELITNHTSTLDDFIDLNYIKKILNSKNLHLQNGTFLNALYQFNRWLSLQN